VGAESKLQEDVEAEGATLTGTGEVGLTLKRPGYDK
jgi:hypothetical protein